MPHYAQVSRSIYTSKEIRQIASHFELCTPGYYLKMEVWQVNTFFKCVLFWWTWPVFWLGLIMRTWSVVIERELSPDLFPGFANLHTTSAQVVKMCRESRWDSCVADRAVVFTAAILHTKTALQLKSYLMVHDTVLDVMWRLWLCSSKTSIHDVS